MRAGLPRTSPRCLTWCCVAILAFLSLLPAQDMMRTGFPGPLEHFAAYAGSGAIAMAGYGLNRGPRGSPGAFGDTRASLNIFSISRRVGIPPLRISPRRRLAPCAAASLLSSSGAIAPLCRAGVIPRSRFPAEAQGFAIFGRRSHGHWLGWPLHGRRRNRLRRFLYRRTLRFIADRRVIARLSSHWGTPY